MKHYFYLTIIFSLLTISSVSFGQQFYGVTKTDGTYDGGTIFSYDGSTGTYTDEYVFKPNPVYDAFQLFEINNGFFVGVCDHSNENSVYGSHDGNAIYSYDSSTGETSIIAELPYPFHAQVSRYNPGYIADVDNWIIGIVTMPDDSIGLMESSLYTGESTIIKKFNAESYPAEGDSSYRADNCYFTALDNHTVLFSLRKIKGLAGSGTSNEGHDFFTFDTQTKSFEYLMNVPQSDNFLAYGPFVKTNDGRWICQGAGGTFMEIDVANKTYSIKAPFDNSAQYNEEGAMLSVTDSTLLGFMEWGSSDFLMEYDFKNDTILGQYILGDRNNTNSFVTFGDSVYFAHKSSDHYRIFSYKPASGNAPVISYQLTEPEQRFIKYLISTSSTSSITAFYTGISEYYPGKRAYVNKVRFGGNQPYEEYADGATPQADLLLGPDDKLYGMASNGGRGTYYNGDGVLFRFDPDNKQYTPLHYFTGDDGGFGSKDGYGTLYGKQQNNLMEYSGKIYGTTYTNGVDEHVGAGCGVVFSYDINAFGNNYKVIYDFNDSTNASTGRWPMSGLVPGPDNKLYGTTSHGGIAEEGVNEGYGGYGVLYSIDPAHNDTFEVVMKFSDTCTVHPIDDLVAVGNGKMYGVADAMKSNFREWQWAIREYDIANKTYTNIYKSNLDDREIVNSGPLYMNGKLYGMVTSSYNNPYLYEFDIATKQLVTKVVFVGSKGASPYGNLTMASNGSLWGMTTEGGDDGAGVIFEYDISGDTYKKHHDFVWEEGKGPLYTGLTEVNDNSTGIFDKKDNKNSDVRVYPNPATEYVTFDFKSGDVQDIKYSVFDISGKLITNGNAKVNNKFTIDLSYMGPGIYTVVLKTGNEILSKKIVKK